MKLRVVINTHGRPAQALAVIECLRTLESGRHEVSYVLACDNEDVATSVLLVSRGMCPPYVELDMRPRPASVQDCWNRNLVNPKHADVWFVMPDDLFCGAPNWDDLAVQTLALAPVPELAVIGWNDLSNPGQLTVPIVAAGWLEAIKPEPFYDPRFEFWFSDTAVAETWSFVFGMTVPRPSFLPLAGMPQRPNPLFLRDGADHLWDLYAATRINRLNTASRIRIAHDLPAPSNLQLLIDGWTERDEWGRRGARELRERLQNKALDNPLDNSGQLVPLSKLLAA